MLLLERNISLSEIVSFGLIHVYYHLYLLAVSWFRMISVYVGVISVVRNWLMCDRPADPICLCIFILLVENSCQSPGFPVPFVRYNYSCQFLLCIFFKSLLNQGRLYLEVVR